MNKKLNEDLIEEKSEDSVDEKENSIEKDKLETENELLRQQLESMQSLISSLQSANRNELNEYEEDIMVSSLCNNPLNLSTEGNGHGYVYTFKSFGEEQSIPTEDLKKIIRNNRSFLDNGYFYIGNDKFKKKEKILNIYKNILNKDEMLELFEKDVETFFKTFNKLSEGQKNTLVSLMINKLAKDEEVDMNIVMKCSDIIGKNIKEIAEVNKVNLRQ